MQGAGPVVGFSIGFLDGWGEIEAPAQARPQFDVVTGSSSGALVAPLAFVGTPAAYEAAVSLALDPPFGFDRPGLWNLRPGRPGVLDNTAMRAGLEEVVTPALVSAVSAGSREQRGLVIAGTNLDLGLGRFWDLGLEIRDLPMEQARRERERDKEE